MADNEFTYQIDQVFRGMERQVRFAINVALNRTASIARNEIKNEISSVFDRPVPYTTNSLIIQPAIPQKLSARLWFKDNRFQPHYLIPQVDGGSRPLKRFEVYLERYGVMPSGMYAVPGNGARLNQYGNISTGQIVQILSHFRAFPEVGYLANRSERSDARRRSRGENRQMLAYGPNNREGIPPGVYLRTSPTSWRQLLAFIKKPQYRKRLKFYEICKSASEREFKRQFERTFEQSTATSNHRGRW